MLSAEDNRRLENQYLPNAQQAGHDDDREDDRTGTGHDWPEHHESSRRGSVNRDVEKFRG